MEFKTTAETAILIVVVLYQISGIQMSSRSPKCDSNWDTCMSKFCRSNQTFVQHICKDGGCQIQGLVRCSSTIRSLVERYPALHSCLCAWEGKRPCGLLRQLSTHCYPQTQPAQQQTLTMDRQASSLQGNVYNSGGSCLQQMSVCIQDDVCNRQLVPVIQTCSSKPCNSSLCGQATQTFYRGLPTGMALGLGMCQCESGDQDCLGVKHTLHSGICEGEEEEKEDEKARTCLETLDGCLKNSPCRGVFDVLLSQCWSEEDRPCSDSSSDDCLSFLDPGLILGGHPECSSALISTVGTSLQHPCSCGGLYQQDLLRCNSLHQVLHNRSHFSKLNTISSSLQPALVSGSGSRGKWISDQLLYVLVYVVLVMAVLLAVVLVFHKLGMHRGTEKTKFHPPDKSGRVIIL